jgi:plasmid rolling circle replication initiator protein Rep
MWRARFFKALPEIQKAFPTARWIFVTLTVKNCELSELRATLTWMNAAWGRLTKRKEFPALGFIKSVEVTRAVNGTAHPHFHCLMLVPAGYFTRGYISHAKWQELWQGCLKTDYPPIVDVRVVKSKTTSSNDGLDPSNNNAMAEAVCETLKYAVKPSDLLADPHWLDELTKQLQKTRTISIGGCLKEYFSEDDPEDLINGQIEEEEKAETELFVTFDWSTIAKRYKKTNDKKFE